MNKTELQQWADEFVSVSQDKALQMWADLNKGNQEDVIAAHKVTSTCGKSVRQHVYEVTIRSGPS